MKDLPEYLAELPIKNRPPRLSEWITYSSGLGEPITYIGILDFGENTQSIQTPPDAQVPADSIQTPPEAQKPTGSIKPKAWSGIELPGIGNPAKTDAETEQD